MTTTISQERQTELWQQAVEECGSPQAHATRFRFQQLYAQAIFEKMNGTTIETKLAWHREKLAEFIGPDHVPDDRIGGGMLNDDGSPHWCRTCGFIWPCDHKALEAEFAAMAPDEDGPIGPLDFE